MIRILSRLLVRVAIVVASLAWAGFVFTQTVGDPGRGEQIAAAVLDDDQARAEIVAPISASVMRTAGLPPELRPVVDAEVDRGLRDPRGAQAFIDPFAGSWARLLGEDDPRPPEFDIAPLLAQLTVIAPPDTDAGRIAVPGVPLPRARLGWMDGVRSTISVSVLPLALVAAGLFAAAFAIGDRRRVLRRLGAWAVTAGLVWVALPPLAAWAARRWAPGADSVIAAALDEATSGLLVIALGLVVGGVAVFASSFAVAPTRAASSPSHSTRRRTSSGAASRSEPRRRAPAPVTRAMPASPGRTIDRTAEMPVAGASSDPPSQPVVDPAVDDDRDALWDYYGSS